MTTPWTPQVAVPRALVARLLAAQCPELLSSDLVKAGVGWDHAVWRSGAVGFRFPHQVESLETAARTAAVLEPLQRRLPLAVPTPLWTGSPTAEYAGRFVAYRWLDGMLPAECSPTVEDRARAVGPLARTLRALHCVPVEEARTWGVGDREDDGELALRTETAQVRATQLAGSVYAELARQASEAMRPTPPECSPAERCVVHGDLHSGQVLMDDERQLVGILDWDEVGVGDPARDLLMVYSFVPPEARSEFFAIYGGFTGEDRARHMALSVGLAILAQAVAGDQAPLARDAALGLRNALSRLT